MSDRQTISLVQTLQQAAHALRTQQFGQAEQLANGILKANRTDRNAALILAHALIGQSRAAEAIAPLERAMRRNDDAEIGTLLGAALCSAERGEDGIAQLRRVASQRPPYLPAFQELAGQLAKAGRLGDAIAVIDEALTLAPASVDLKLDLGRLCQQNNERVKARAALEAARDASPGRHDILTELAWVLYRDGDYAASADVYRHALGLRPDDTMARGNLAACLFELGQRDAGDAALRSVLAGRPNMLSRTAYVLATTAHGRFFFRPSAAAKYFGREQN